MNRKLYESVIIILALLAVPLSAYAQEFHVIPYDETLETLNDFYGADAFNHMLYHPDSRYYSHIDFYDEEPTESLHILPHFSTYQQTTEYSCGNASALMVLNYFGNHDYNELQLADIMETHPTKGTTVEAAAAFFESIGYEVEFHADTEKMFTAIETAEAFLIDKIDSGIPVMVSWVDWQGHWQTVIGIDEMNTESPWDDVIIFADSYDVTDHYQDGYYIYPLGRFLGMWREGPCVEKAVPYEQPFVAAHPADLLTNTAGK